MLCFHVERIPLSLGLEFEASTNEVTNCNVFFINKSAFYFFEGTRNTITATVYSICDTLAVLWRGKRLFGRYETHTKLRYTTRLHSRNEAITILFSFVKLKQ